MGYTLATCKKLVENGAEVHIVHWDHKKLSKYDPANPKEFFFIKGQKIITYL